MKINPIAGMTFTAGDKKVVAIIDDFSREDTSIGTYNGVRHGDLVKKYATAGIEDKVEVIPFDAVDCCSGGWMIISSDKIRGALEELIRMKEHGQPVDAVNISVNSWGEYFDYKELSSKLHKKLTPKNIQTYKDLMFNIFKKSAHDQEKDFMEEIELAQKLEVPVFKASGNQGPDSFNHWHFADGIKIVGATDKSGRLTKYSSENPFVTNYARGTYEFEPVYDENGGYKGVTDGVISFDAKDTDGWQGPRIKDEFALDEQAVYQFAKGKQSPDKYVLIGTSFAAPTRLNQYLKNDYHVDRVTRPYVPYDWELDAAAGLYLEIIEGARAYGYLDNTGDDRNAQKEAVTEFLKVHEIYHPGEFELAKKILKSAGVIK